VLSNLDEASPINTGALSTQHLPYDRTAFCSDCLRRRFGVLYFAAETFGPVVALSSFDGSEAEAVRLGLDPILALQSAPLLVRFIPDSLRDSAPLCLKPHPNATEP
jgi:hypothetical protein